MVSVSYDWLTATYEDEGVIQAYEYFNGQKSKVLSDIQMYTLFHFFPVIDEKYIVSSSPRWGYSSVFSYSGITVMYNNRSNGCSVCVNLSGQACRACADKIEPFIEWLKLAGGKVTRLDIAIDDKDGLLDIDKIFQRSEMRYKDDGNKNEACYWWGDVRSSSRLESSRGTTMYYGSLSSDFFIRIYDKEKESNLDTGHWIRVEMVFRKEYSWEMAKACVKDGLGKSAYEFINRKLIFVDCPITQLTDGKESVEAMQHIESWWKELLNNVENGLRIRGGKNVRDIASITSYIENQCVRAIALYADYYGHVSLLNMIDKGRKLYKIDDIQMLTEAGRSTQGYESDDYQGD